MLTDTDRVAVTGLGVVTPGATGLPAFEALLRSGRSSVAFVARLEALQFSCRVSGQCQLTPDALAQALTPLEQRRLTSSGLRFALLAGEEALRRSGVPLGLTAPEVRRSVVFGGSIPSMDVLRDAFALTDAGKVRKLGSSTVELQMPSTPAAHLAARFGAGGAVTSNAAACATGTEALILGYQRIVRGEADVVLVGSTEAESPHLWASFDALRVLSHTYNSEPTRASRPLSASANGFVPAGGAAALVLERWSSAVARGAPIWCEVLGGAVNCGAQLQGGSLTAQNPNAARRCVHDALIQAGVHPSELDAISGHLTATQADPAEVACWSDVIERQGQAFPLLNAPKSLWGHALSASGSIELVACAVQLHHGFLHASLNCEDLHPAVLAHVNPANVVRETTTPERLHVIAKSSFGFGDVNACALLRKAQ